MAWLDGCRVQTFLTFRVHAAVGVDSQGGSGQRTRPGWLVLPDACQDGCAMCVGASLVQDLVTEETPEMENQNCFIGEVFYTK